MAGRGDGFFLGITGSDQRSACRVQLDTHRGTRGWEGEEEEEEEA